MRARRRQPAHADEPVPRAVRGHGPKNDGSKWLDKELYLSLSMASAEHRPARPSFRPRRRAQVVAMTASPPALPTPLPVARTGRVLLLAAKDALGVVRRRLDGICAAAGIDLAALDLNVITAPTRRIDTPNDQDPLMVAQDTRRGRRVRVALRGKPPVRSATYGLHERGETAALGMQSLETVEQLRPSCHRRITIGGRGTRSRDVVQGGSHHRNFRWCSSPRELVTS